MGEISSELIIPSSIVCSERKKEREEERQLFRNLPYEMFDVILEYSGETILNIMQFRCISRYCKDYIDHYSLVWSRFRLIELNCPRQLRKDRNYFGLSEPVKIQWMNRVCDYGEKLSMPIDYKYSNADHPLDQKMGYLKVIMYTSGDDDLDFQNIKQKSRLIKEAFLHNLHYFHHRWNSMISYERLFFDNILFSSRICILILFVLRSFFYLLSRAPK